MPENYEKSLDARNLKGRIQSDVKALRQYFTLRHLPILDGIKKNFND